MFYYRITNHVPGRNLLKYKCDVAHETAVVSPDFFLRLLPRNCRGMRSCMEFPRAVKLTGKAVISGMTGNHHRVKAPLATSGKECVLRFLNYDCAFFILP